MSDTPAPSDDTSTDRAVRDADTANGEPDATQETGEAQAAGNSERDLPG